MEDLYYNYIYLDPRKPGCYSYPDLHMSFLYEPFYVGKGKKYRLNNHINAVICGGYVYNQFKVSKIKKILSENLRPFIEICFNNLSEKQAFENEKFLISKIGRKDKKIGPLCNFTDGGEGSSGRKLSETTKNKIRQKAIGRKAKQQTIEKMKKNNSGKNNPRFGKKWGDNPNLTKKRKQVIQYDLNLNIVNSYESLSEAARQNKMSSGAISLCCNNLKLNYRGFIWKFA